MTASSQPLAQVSGPLPPGGSSQIPLLFSYSQPGYSLLCQLRWPKGKETPHLTHGTTTNDIWVCDFKLLNLRIICYTARASWQFSFHRVINISPCSLLTWTPAALPIPFSPFPVEHHLDSVPHTCQTHPQVRCFLSAAPSVEMLSSHKGLFLSDF